MDTTAIRTEQILQLAENDPAEAFRLLNEQTPPENISEFDIACREYISGKYFFEKENYTEALPQLADCLQRIEGVKDLISLFKKTIELLVRIYRKIGDSPNAASLLRSSIETMDKLGAEKETLSLFLTLAEIYMSTHNHVEALRNFQILYQRAEKYNDREMMSEALFKIGNAYNWNEQIKEAEEYLLKAKEMKMKEGFDPSWVMASLGILYTKTEAFDLSLSCFREGIELCKKTGDLSLQANILKSMGNLYNLMKKPEKAIDMLEQALKIAEAMPHKTVMMLSHQFLSESFEMTDELSRSLFHYKEYFKLNEEIKSSNTNVQLKGMQLKYDVDEARKESEIYKLKNIDLANANSEIERQKKEITDSIIYAKRIQQAILPPAEIFSHNLSDHFILFQPKDIVSGDFYWAAECGKKFIFAVVDCTGHGVPGAFLSMIAYNLLNQAVNEHGIDRPDAILQYLHKGIYKTFLNVSNERSVNDSMDIALCTIDTKNKKLEYAGVFNPIYILENNILKEIKGDKIQLGNGTEVKFTAHLIDINGFDSFYIFSDGFADQFGGPKARLSDPKISGSFGQGKKFKHKQLKEVLSTISNEKMSSQKNMLENKFNEWRGNAEQVDDICIIGFKPKI